LFWAASPRAARLPLNTARHSHLFFMLELLAGAVGLMLIIEGLLPLVAPRAWRDTFERILKLGDGQIRFVGLISMVAGLLLITLWTTLK
jgi:uncharacterized protein